MNKVTSSLVAAALLLFANHVVADDTQDDLHRRIGEAYVRVQDAQTSLSAADRALKSAISALQQLSRIDLTRLWVEEQKRLIAHPLTQPCGFSVGSSWGPVSWFPDYDEVVKLIIAQDAAKEELTAAKDALTSLEAQRRD